MFIDLKQPCAIATGKWFVQTVHSKLSFLDRNGQVVKGQQNDIYFDSECDAHVAVATYYHQHNEHYPYYDAWNAALYREEYGTDGTVQNGVGTVESEVMEFI